MLSDAGWGKDSLAWIHCSEKAVVLPRTARIEFSSGLLSCSLRDGVMISHQVVGAGCSKVSWYVASIESPSCRVYPDVVPESWKNGCCLTSPGKIAMPAVDLALVAVIHAAF